MVITEVVLCKLYDLFFISCVCGICYLKREISSGFVLFCGKDMLLGGEEFN